MSVALSKKGPVLSSDACLPLISLYKAVQEGWDPPTEVSKETYMAAKLLPDTDPMKAFCGFGCSFGGKWFGGYAKGFNGPLTYPQLAARNVTRNVLVPNISFDEIDFCLQPCKYTQAIIYCDPPYKNTTNYSAIGKFNYDLFTNKVLEWSKFTNIFVSEYSFPIGICIWERKSRGTLGLDHGIPHCERLYHIPKQP